MLSKETLADIPSGHRIVELFNSNKLNKVLFKKIHNICIDSACGFKEIAKLDSHYRNTFIQLFRANKIEEADKLECDLFVKDCTKSIIYFYSRKYFKFNLGISDVKN